MAKKSATKKAGTSTKKPAKKRKATVGKKAGKKARSTKAASTRRKSSGRGAKNASAAMLKNIKDALNKKGIEPADRITNALAFL